MSAHHDSSATCSGLSSGRSGDAHPVLGAEASDVSVCAGWDAAGAPAGSADVPVPVPVPVLVLVFVA
ncbi:MAG TPA: hypothetical protein VES03_07655 [Motilibacterales bacterium]|nr:hypothetical protein [Motilibacterales bacterium]